MLAVLGVAGFFASMFYFKLFETKIIYTDWGYMKGFLLSFVLLLLAAFGAGCVLGGPKIGRVTTVISALFLSVAFFIGYLREIF